MNQKIAKNQLATSCLKNRQKRVTRDDKTITAVVAFGKSRWKWIRDKQGAEKCKPTKRRNSNH